MRLINYATKWDMPSRTDMKSDFEEYKKKEQSKWKRRAEQYGFRFPIFDKYSDFISALKGGRVVTLTDGFEKQIPDTSYCDSIECIEQMVRVYKRPRDVQRIVKGIKGGDTLPYPIILKGKNGFYRLAGNTRMNVARVMKAPVKVLIVDVSDGDI